LTNFIKTLNEKNNRKMTLEAFKNKLNNTPKEVAFSETIAAIEANYNA